MLSLLLLLLFAAPIPPSDSAIPSYSTRCAALVPSSPVDSTSLVSPPSLHVENGYFSGGDAIFGPDHNGSLSVPRSLRFRPLSIQMARDPGVFAVRGVLRLRGGSIYVVRRNFTAGRRGLFRVVRPRGPAMLRRRGMVSFTLEGFWSETLGKLCMVGTGSAWSREGKSLDLSAVLKLNYPKVSNITNSLVTGTVESLDFHGNPNYFDRISLIAYSQNIYEYSLIPEAKKMSLRDVTSERSPLGLGGDDNLCSILGSLGFRLVYGSDCIGKCSPVDGNNGFRPSFLHLEEVQCLEDGRLRMSMMFSDGHSSGYHNFVWPQRMLFGEGFWDQERKHLSVVLCRVLNSDNTPESAYIGDCTIGFRLWFPETLTIGNRNPVIGQIWSTRTLTDPDHFGVIILHGLDDNRHPLFGLRYTYTKIDLARKSCMRNVVGSSRGRRYPSGKSATDLRFDVNMRNSAGEIVWAYANPISIGETLYGNSYTGETAAFHSEMTVEASHDIWNISYNIGGGFYNGSSDLKELKDISAEGIYNEQEGTLCLIGCREIGFSNNQKQLKKTDSMDCEIFINVQLSPLDSGPEDHLNGTIRSLRNKSDPLYFKPLEISSYVMYKVQAVESIWRLDMEITLVLITLTLSCVFIGLQLYYVNKHPDVLPSTSITMLVVLTLGHMIPLVLNFEALFFMNRNKQNVLLWSGGWLEVNEVVVRLITMIAFLLQFRFLQVAWSARSRESGSNLWAAERKALQLSLPLYFIGFLIAWFVHLELYESQIPSSAAKVAVPRSFIWEDLISYAGLVLDGFLLPQILLNIFSNSKEKVLVPTFYVGTTIVRSLPHIYDAYRAQHFAPHVNSSYIYASPQGDLYSSIWDVIIPCEGVLFASIIYFQQRFGGNCIVPAKFRNQGGYEIVPVVS